jgi:hypothetical protein
MTTTTTTPRKTGTWQDLFPTLKPAAATATHPKYGQVDIMKWHANGRAGIRYLSNRQCRMFTTSVDPAELVGVVYR